MPTGRESWNLKYRRIETSVVVYLTRIAAVADSSHSSDSKHNRQLCKSSQPTTKLSSRHTLAFCQVTNRLLACDKIWRTYRWNETNWKNCRMIYERK